MATHTLSIDASVHEVELRCGDRIVVRLLNDSLMAQAFKVKTNGPRRWSVKPNGGVLSAGECAEVTFKLIAQSNLDTAAATTEFDRHLILSAPVDSLNAARLRQQRLQSPRSSLDTPTLETPSVSQLRITPIFGSSGHHADAMLTPVAAPPPAPGFMPVQHSVVPPTEAAVAAVAASQPMLSPFVSPMSSPLLPNEPPSAEVVAAPTPPQLPPQTPMQKQQSVAERVAALDRRLAPLAQRSKLNGSHVAAPDDASEGGSSDARRVASGRRSTLVGYLLSLLNRGSDELLPWLSWKIFDILFALLLLRLSKRFRCLRQLQDDGVL